VFINIKGLPELVYSDSHKLGEILDWTRLTEDDLQYYIGGGLCVYVDTRWATQYTVRERVCTHDYEILVISFRPFYLPREFEQITIILAYDFVGAAARIAESYNIALSRAVSQPVLLLGDFKFCNLSDHLPTLHQYVDCPTRLERTLDKCYGNILDAYKSICRPALGKSDHNVVHLLPRYRAKLRREKTVIKEIKIWTEDCMEEMRCELETTDWTFLKLCDSPHEQIDTFTFYLLFNVSKIARTKIVRIFPNNNVWMSSDLKECIRKKKQAFKSGNIELLKEKRNELRSKLSKAKIE